MRGVQTDGAYCRSRRRHPENLGRHLPVCLLTLSGHLYSVMACAWSPDGQRLLSTSADGTLRIWDAASGHFLLTLSGHSSPVRACAWSPNKHNTSCPPLTTAPSKSRNTTSGHCLWTGHVFPEGQTAALDETQGRILHASPEAWRWRPALDRSRYRAHPPASRRILRPAPCLFLSPSSTIGPIHTTGSSGASPLPSVSTAARAVPACTSNRDRWGRRTRHTVQSG